MTDTKHTPGPWHIEKVSQNMTITGNVHQVTDKDKFPSAFVPAWDNPPPDGIDGSEEALANARLIAAAPELLEALEEVLDALGFLSGGDHELEGWGIDERRGAEIRAAIAKAKGEGA